jgi:ribosomal protein L37AE/L43A
MKQKISKAAGRFGVKFGQYARRTIAKVEAKQRKKQQCTFCNGTAKRISKGIWLCKKCGKKFTGHAYYLERENEEGQKKSKDTFKKSKELRKKENKTKNNN